VQILKLINISQLIFKTIAQIDEYPDNLVLNVDERDALTNLFPV